MVVQEITDVCYQHIFSLFTTIGLDSLKVRWPLIRIRYVAVVSNVQYILQMLSHIHVAYNHQITYHITWLGFCQLYRPESYVLERWKQCLSTPAPTNAKCVYWHTFSGSQKKLYVNVWTYYCIQFFISSRHLKNIARKTKTYTIRRTGFSKVTLSCLTKIIILLLPCPLYVLLSEIC